ncbi:MAG: rod shape-determining protein RodA [Cyclobacteriaceae bacterium]|nr:rod shape-determining protein RodA [Cyclobacteriaceae bacterium]
MRRGEETILKIDWTALSLYILLVLVGWLNIYASVYDENTAKNIFDVSTNSGRQFIFILLSVIPVFLIWVIDFRFFYTFSFIIYGLSLLLLVVTLFIARDINGAHSWIEIGSFRFQPSEFVKISTCLMLARIFSITGFKATKLSDIGKAVLVLGIPFILIVLQRDMGTALVFLALIIVLYREGMSPIPIIAGLLAVIILALTLMVERLYLLLGIIIIFLLIILLIKKKFRNIALTVVGMALLVGFIYSVDFILNDVLSKYQKERIELVFNPNADPLGAGWNVTQSKIAIGSGGINGKGYLNGTQTKFDFVPEQSTDFIFCTIGEEHGFIGSFIFIVLFVTLLLRIIVIAERQKWRFARVYGYGVASILFIHFVINVGMTIGLFPVIGIPLPFFSYGGSSLFSFTILLFLLLKFDLHRSQVLDR